MGRAPTVLHLSPVQTSVRTNSQMCKKANSICAARTNKTDSFPNHIRKQNAFCVPRFCVNPQKQRKRLAKEMEQSDNRKYGNKEMYNSKTYDDKVFP